MKKDKYLQIFNYLLEFSKLRSNPVKDIIGSAQYDYKIWLSEVYDSDLFESALSPDFNSESEYWIKVWKPRDEPSHPNFPKLPKILEKWIIKDSLVDEINLPKLYESITSEGKQIFLVQNPDVEQEFRVYLNNKWIEDLEKYKELLVKYNDEYRCFEKQSNTWNDFFSIFNKVQQFSDEFELILGFGLINFHERSDTALICRHFLTIKVDISYNSNSRGSFIEILPRIDAELQIESDSIIDPSNLQFDSTIVLEGEKCASLHLKQNELTSYPFNYKIKETISIYANRIRQDAEFIDSNERPKTVPEKPTVYYAPAILLRKRNTKSFTSLYEKIIENITNAGDDIDIPAIDNIIGYSDDSEINDDALSIPSSASGSIYFPKKYNDEQIEIVRKVEKSNKILVQGPPGTGKSHTIANLICHFLANGKKVLVTAQTERALKVIRRQLPADFRNLTVNLLTYDKSEAGAEGDLGDISGSTIDASVNSIIEKLSRFTDLDTLKNQIEEKEIMFSLQLEEIATTTNLWLDVREKSTRKMSIHDRYRGSLLEIAEQLEKEREDFEWFKDEIFTIEDFNIDLIIEFYQLHQKYQSLDCKAFDYVLPNLDILLSVESYTDYLRLFSEFSSISHNYKEYFSIDTTDYDLLRANVTELINDLKMIEINQLPFKNQITETSWTGFDFWIDKINRTNKILTDLQSDTLTIFEKKYDVTIPNDKTIKQLLHDAEILLSFLDEGNELDGIIFTIKKILLPSRIKERLYFLKDVLLNGTGCKNKQELQIVIRSLAIIQNIDELKGIWNVGVPDGMTSSYDTAKFFERIAVETNELINQIVITNKLIEKINRTSSLHLSIINSNSLSELIKTIDYNIIKRKVNNYKNRLDSIVNELLKYRMHPICKEIIELYSRHDLLEYGRVLTELEELNRKKTSYNDYQTIREKLNKILPRLTEDIINSEISDENIKQLENAIYHKFTSTNVRKLLEPNSELSLFSKLSVLESDKSKIITELASMKSWYWVLTSLTENPRLQQHLQAWALAVKKIPKTGKGARALKFRREAQDHMAKCKDSVPCWIMPLYKIAETVHPLQGMYDYIIVDEASQLGADAIFLLYLSKKIIIVGDDKQTSPEYVGIEAGKMDPFIKKHLDGMQFAKFFGTEYSFFDQAKLFCTSGLTVLREHFRCMPEIIEFSNKYFYEPDGKSLYPLRQYSEKRLEPLKSVYCENGYTEGNSQNISNSVEAKAIAAKIKELVNNPAYDNKTFGVIALQGNVQAAKIDLLINKAIGSDEYNKRRIQCGNSASFQGDERDVMFLSLITAHNHKRNSLTGEDYKRRYNVAVSRAKDQAWLFHSVKLEDLTPNDLRYNILDHFLNYRPRPVPQNSKIPRTRGSQPAPFESWFEVDVYNDIVAKNYSVIPQYEVVNGRFRIDLVVILPNGTKIAVECDGDRFHSTKELQYDLTRQNILERCGWQFFRVRGAEYYSNRLKSMEPLWQLLASNEKEIKSTVKESDKSSGKNEVIELSTVFVSPILSRDSTKQEASYEYDFSKELELSTVDRAHQTTNSITGQPESKQNNNHDPSNKPKGIRIQDEEFLSEYSNQVLISTAKWLIKKGYIKSSKLPIPIYGTSKYLINNTPVHKFGKKFENSREIGHGIFIELNWSSNDCVKKSQYLFNYFNVSKDEYEFLF